MFSGIRRSLTPESIRTQLTLWYLVMLAAALAAFAVFVFIARARTLMREADAGLQVHAYDLIAQFRPELLGLDVGGALRDDPRAWAEPFVLRESWGTLVFRSPAFPELDAVSERRLAEVARDSDAVAVVDDRAGVGCRVLTRAVERPGANPLILQVAVSMAPARHILAQLATAMALWFIVVLAVASYGGSFIARRALAPVETIVGRVRTIQASQLADRLDVRTGSQELDRLVETLNGMLDRIEGSMRSARRFAADASHELQTPIAAMRTTVDLSLRDGHTAHEYQVIAVDLLGEIDRLSALVRDLRLLALADAGHLLGRPEPVNLGELVQDCCEIVRAIAEPKGVVVTSEVEPDVIVSGSALHLRRVVLNLAQNAVRHSPDGAPVCLAVSRFGSEAAIAVADQGAGIAAEDLPHIFDRFYRADPARARDTGGTGLGLAIADQIVRTHGGRIEVSSTVGEGSTFLVFLSPAPVPTMPAALPETINAF